MTIHHEGFRTIIIVLIAAIIINAICFYCIKNLYINIPILTITFLLWIAVVAFFRVPSRNMTYDPNAIVAPADGKVIIIEEINEDEYFKDKRLKISIFMSPLNVHVNRYSISGKILYSAYHPGKYLMAFHPKSSILNEHHTTVIENDSIVILEKQIAGFIARRIVNYAKVGDHVQQNNELGFIKFGSRVDVILPIGTKLNVKIGDHVKGGVSTLCKY